MHPMFVELFMETDADDLLAMEEEEARRRSRRLSRRTRLAVIAKSIPSDHTRIPRR